MEKKYWNGTGKYQKELERMEQLIPIMGRTDNKYMNLFLVATNIYYDVYNNGGCNISCCYMDDVEKYLIPFNSEFRMSFIGDPEKIEKRFCNKKTLENFMNRAIELVIDKDLTYTQYVIYSDCDSDKISKEPKAGFEKIVFGEKDCYNRYIENRLKWGFEMV